MSEFDKKTIKNLARLCRIQCTEEEEDSLLLDLKKILDYVEQMQEIDTSKVPPCSHVLEDLTAFMRDDIPGDTLPREVFLSNAPDVIGGMVRVPKVLKN